MDSQKGSTGMADQWKQEDYGAPHGQNRSIYTQGQETDKEEEDPIGSLPKNCGQVEIYRSVFASGEGTGDSSQQIDMWYTLPHWMWEGKSEVHKSLGNWI